ncbi:putative UPF0481 protein At3g02645 [Coffea arabica]|uniref:UPF0481 protein At3g02645 n=1 Tax=Coffea arabica TaxID=13443 RepID=A0A6P6X8A9_COFAR|nr:putative UPF0481 protein At3g02645 [Coffea arabica]
MRLNYIKNYTVRPCVFHAPDNLRDTKPEAYTPQLVGLGPYHHFWPQVQHMESHKRATVLDYLEGLNKEDFIKLVEEGPEDFEPKIRSCYDRYLDLDKETLAWVVIVDGLFLLDLIDYLGSEEPNKNNPGSEDVEKDRIYSKPEALAADVFMLENQIPIVLIQEMRAILQESFDIDSDAELFGKFVRFCDKYSPLKLTSDSTSRNEAFDNKKHLLHFMYQMIVKNNIRDFNPETIPQDNRNNNHDSVGIGDEVRKISQTNQEHYGESRAGAIAKAVASHAGEFLEHAIEEFDSALSDAKMAGIKLPGNVEKVTNILRNLQKNIQHVNHKKDGSLGDQIGIPSASRLYIFLKMKFKPLPKDCGIGNITLDGEKRILCLPVITLRANSEVILRNLVAYEATSKMGSTQMRDYVDLMCGLIRSEKDVEMLKRSGVIETKIPDEEIFKMCNGFTKSDEKPDEVSKVAGTVKEVSNQFNDVRIVKASRCCMKVSADCVKFWRPLFPIFVVLLLLFQSICEIWDCRRRSSLGGGALRDLYLGDLGPEATLMLPRKMYPY